MAARNNDVRRLECDGKRAFTTLNEAERVASDAARVMGHHMHAYRCNFCKRFDLDSHSVKRGPRLEPYRRQGRPIEEWMMKA